ncbi:hypothetical protein LRS10_04905 [Phenylobacterium sp. J426]|uniref:hypothetical protein n=1 Tax=Phenylobacterium sp. J426 TaxID=2898439 RepID=UPI002151AF1C|nr:hypothetical protein [Phenylobacterium sp. J426]MCR5873574.1 hypothetical protein [Phenylobacterium sp. J426]
MTRAETYLKHAAEAEALAARAQSLSGRLRCLDLAEGYRALAERMQAIAKPEPRSWAADEHRPG